MPLNLMDDQFIKFVQTKLSSQKTEFLRIFSEVGYIQASVLIPIIKLDNDFFILYTKRTASVKDHQNQVSFPGGKIEPSDINPLAAAFRETKEEIGISQQCIEILGKLEPRITPTGYLIHPFIGFIHETSGMIVNRQEVEKIIYIPLNWLQDPANSYQEILQNRAEKVLFFEIFDGEILWGITASITKEFIDVILRK